MSFVPYPSLQPKRPPLDREQVVKAALELLDEEGLDNLTMRRVADKLGTKAAALYRHVKDKAELLVLLGDEISAEVPLVEPVGSWEQQLLAMAHNSRKGLLAHRDGARVLATTMPVGPRRLVHVEAVMRTLRSAGLSKRDTVRFAYHMNNYVTEFAADESRFAGAPEIEAFFASLPAEEFPTLNEVARELAHDDPDALFEFGLQVWIDAVKRVIAAR